MSVVLNLSTDAEQEWFAGLPALIFKYIKKIKELKLLFKSAKISNIMSEHIVISIQRINPNRLVI